MKTFTLGLEFTDGSYDLRTVKANTSNEAKEKILQQNTKQLSNKAMFPNTKEILTAEVQ